MSVITCARCMRKITCEVHLSAPGVALLQQAHACTKFHHCVQHSQRQWNSRAYFTPRRAIQSGVGKQSLTPGWLWVDTSRTSGQCQRAGRVWRGGPHLSPEVSFFQTSGSPMLPSSLRLSGVCFWLQHWSTKLLHDGTSNPTPSNSP